jgi:nucleoside-diphosphate-sugar epimerase
MQILTFLLLRPYITNDVVCVSFFLRNTYRFRSNNRTNKFIRHVTFLALSMQIIIFGATGAIGSECVRQAIEDADIQSITAITRRPLDPSIVSDKLTVVLHTDFLDYTPLLNLFQKHQLCIWALGVSQNAVTESEYIQITHDYTLAAAKAIASVNPDMRFVFVSGMGADSAEQSRFLFGRIKGKTENDLVNESGLKETYTVRPAGVLFSQPLPNKAWYERAVQPLAHVVKIVKPSWIITSVALARAILYIGKNGHHATLFENEDLKDVVSQKHLAE